MSDVDAPIVCLSATLGLPCYHAQAHETMGASTAAGKRRYYLEECCADGTSLRAPETLGYPIVLVQI